ncbi:MAG TPA: hypothetical protein VF175_18750 [Lacipirellula sp.]
MATVETLPPRDAVDRDDFEYRPLSVTAVASAVFGVLSALIFFAGRDSIESALMLTPLPLIGLALGLRARGYMRANPDQYSGQRFANVGTALSAACLAGGMAFSGYVYATEVPDGYVRTSFRELRPDQVDLRADRVIPPSVQALEGKKVFIKGYMRPGSHYTAGGQPVSSGIARFLLVRDNAQCCYGDLSAVKYFDQMLVVMKTNERLSYRGGVFRMGGTLRLHPEFAHDTSRGPTYVLEADYAE